MLFFAKRQNIINCCSVLYCFDYDRKSTKELFDFICSYFKLHLNIDFKYCGFYNETYNDTYGKFELIKLKMLKERATEIVNFTLDDDDIRNGNRKVSVEFNITRPITLTISINDGYGLFDLKEFSIKVYCFFAATYAFTYLVGNSDWPTAYAKGDEQHTKNVIGIKRVSKEVLLNWRKKCELIQSGLIRDVYKENIINTAHLLKSINNKTMREFITNDKIGNLEEINQKIFFWRLDDSEIEKAREYLYKTAIII